jgi:hypothetical protein
MGNKYNFFRSFVNKIFALFVPEKSTCSVIPIRTIRNFFQVVSQEILSTVNPQNSRMNYMRDRR